MGTVLGEMEGEFVFDRAKVAVIVDHCQIGIHLSEYMPGWQQSSNYAMAGFSLST